MTIKFMGVQEDPELDVIEARGNVRIYDGTKRLLLDDVRAFLDRVTTDRAVRLYSEKLAEDAGALLKRIDGGER